MTLPSLLLWQWSYKTSLLAHKLLNRYEESAHTDFLPLILKTVVVGAYFCPCFLHNIEIWPPFLHKKIQIFSLRLLKKCFKISVHPPCWCVIVPLEVSKVSLWWWYNYDQLLGLLLTQLSVLIVLGLQTTHILVRYNTVQVPWAWGTI